MHCANPNITTTNTVKSMSIEFYSDKTLQHHFKFLNKTLCTHTLIISKIKKQTKFEYLFQTQEVNFFLKFNDRRNE